MTYSLCRGNSSNVRWLWFALPLILPPILGNKKLGQFTKMRRHTRPLLNHPSSEAFYEWHIIWAGPLSLLLNVLHTRIIFKRWFMSLFSHDVFNTNTKQIRYCQFLLHSSVTWYRLFFTSLFLAFQKNRWCKSTLLEEPQLLSENIAFCYLKIHSVVCTYGESKVFSLTQFWDSLLCSQPIRVSSSVSGHGKLFSCDPIFIEGEIIEWFEMKVSRGPWRSNKL